MATYKRMKPDDRKEKILLAAMALSVDVGYKHVTRLTIAKKAQVHESLINHYFGTINELRRSIVKAAVDSENYDIIAQCIVMGDNTGVVIPQELIESVTSYLKVKYAQNTAGI